jgi:hypothetical protein
MLFLSFFFLFLYCPATPAPVSPELRVLLAENGYGDNPAIHSHLLECHENIIDLIQKKQSLIADHRQRIEEKNSWVFILTHDTEEQLLQIAAASKMHPKAQLGLIIQDIFRAEEGYPF